MSGGMHIDVKKLDKLIAGQRAELARRDKVITEQRELLENVASNRWLNSGAVKNNAMTDVKQYLEATKDD